MNLQSILDIATWLVEIGLIEFKPGMGLSEIEAEYRERISATMQGYLDSERTIVSFRNDMRRTTNDAYLLAAVAGWVDGGGDGPMPDSLTGYVNQQVEAQFTFIDDVFAKLKELRKSGTQDEQAAYIEGRADGYTASIQGIYDYSRVTAAKDTLLTFDGPDGSADAICQKTGGTCVRLKGQTHKASWWIEQNLIPFPGNSNYDCGAWKCRHQLIDKDGNVWANQQVSEFDPDQPRDDTGRFSSTGGGGMGGDDGGGGRNYSSDNPADASKGMDDLMEESKEWVDSLGSSELQAIKEYTDSNVGDEINRYMRTGDTYEIPVDEIAPLAESLQGALARATMKEDTVAYRGVSASVAKGLSVGDEKEWKAFTSTSLAERYASWFGKGDTKTMKVIISAKTHAAPISRLGIYQGEYEVLLNAGTKYKVVAVTAKEVTVRTIP